MSNTVYWAKKEWRKSFWTFCASRMYFLSAEIENFAGAKFFCNKTRKRTRKTLKCLFILNEKGFRVFSSRECNKDYYRWSEETSTIMLKANFFFKSSWKNMKFWGRRVMQKVSEKLPVVSKLQDLFEALWFIWSRLLITRVLVISIRYLF